MTLVVPRYGAGTLADVVPSVLAGMEVPGMINVLGLPPASRVCLLLVDGLGWRLLRSHEAEAPFLSSLAAEGEPITAGFPATTATSVASVGTGLPSGEHGLVATRSPPGMNCSTCWAGTGTAQAAASICGLELFPSDFSPARPPSNGPWRRVSPCTCSLRTSTTAVA